MTLWAIQIKVCQKRALGGGEGGPEFFLAFYLCFCCFAFAFLLRAGFCWLDVAFGLFFRVLSFPPPLLAIGLGDYDTPRNSEKYTGPLAFSTTLIIVNLDPVTGASPPLPTPDLNLSETDNLGRKGSSTQLAARIMRFKENEFVGRGGERGREEGRGEEGGQTPCMLLV